MIPYMMVNLIAIFQNFGQKWNTLKLFMGISLRKIRTHLNLIKICKKIQEKIYYTFITLESKTYLNNKAMATLTHFTIFFLVLLQHQYRKGY